MVDYTMKCKYQNCPKEAGVAIVGKNTERQRSFCSVQCKNKFFVDKRRWELKIKAVASKGGRCSKCGYDKCVTALEFHHRNPEEKEFEISHCHSKSWIRVQEEVSKCELLCSNCHKEEEYRKQSEYKSFIPQMVAQYLGR